MADHLQAIALTIYAVIVVTMVTIVIVVTRIEGNKRYASRTLKVIDQALPREQAAGKWAANREAQRQ